MPAASVDPTRLEVPASTLGAAASDTRRDAPRTPGAAASDTRRDAPRDASCDTHDHTDPAAATDAIAELRHLMWEHGGLLRHADGLRTALRELDRLTPVLERDAVGRNLGVVAGVVLRAALAREGSRGGHHRIDHPRTEPGPGHHTLVQRDEVPYVPLDGSAGPGGLDLRHEVAS